MNDVKKKRLENDLEWLDHQLKAPVIKYIAANGILFCILAGGLALFVSKGREAFSSPVDYLIRHFVIYFIAGLVVGWFLRKFLIYKRKNTRNKLGLEEVE